MSSNSDSLSPDPYQRGTINSEQLIAEVKKRPLLWDKNDPQHANRQLRFTLWTEVAKSMWQSEWSNYSGSQKRLTARAAQKKWKNLKDTYVRATVKRRSMPSAYKKRKRKYIYSDALSFLSPVLPKSRESKQTQDSYVTIMDEIMDDPFDSDGNRSDHDFSESKAQVSIKVEEDEEEEEESNEIEIPLENPAIERDGLVQILLSKERRYNDEDIAFAEMLVPLLRKLDDEQKHQAKLEILNVLHKAKKYKS